MGQKHFYEFGPFRVDLALQRLERGGAALPLPPKAFDLLVLLARNTDRVMAKSELIETLWPNTFVGEANLTQHVYTLRKALGDQPNGQPYIDTVPRRGYRLAAEVRDASSGSGPADTSTAATMAAPAGLEDERKYATALHCAVADAAAIVERDGSSELQKLIRQLLEIGQTEIAQYDGVITQQHPNGFVAIFGAQTVHEDDGRRAILAALAIQRQSAALALELRIGIDAGPLVVSRIAGARETNYTVVGDTMRAADLLHQFAAPGVILISHAVWRTVDRLHRRRGGESGASRSTRLSGDRPSAAAGRRLAARDGRSCRSSDGNRRRRSSNAWAGRRSTATGRSSASSVSRAWASRGSCTNSLADARAIPGPSSRSRDAACPTAVSFPTCRSSISCARICVVDDTDPPDVIRDAVERCRCARTGCRQTPPRGCSVWLASTTIRPRPNQ